MADGSDALVLASTSPQRRAILEQLRIPFTVVAPDYEEIGDDPVEHAAGKARSVDGAGLTVLGVDTDVFVDGRRFGKAATPAEAVAMLERLAGGTHEVVSGLCLLGPSWEELHRAVTLVEFRPLAEREIERYVEAGNPTTFR